jgi:SM-20-related protein
VYYPHHSWHPDWGGDTVIFNQEKTDIIGCVYPRSNRMLIFDGTIPHVARGVSRICPVLRVTLMFKTDMLNQQER